MERKTDAKERKLWPDDLLILESFDPKMQINWQIDAGDISKEDTRYVLRWESLPHNRDRARDTVPRPSMLRLYKIRYD